MKQIIQQSVTLPASAETLFDTNLDPAGHGAVTGGSVSVSSAAGSWIELNWKPWRAWLEKRMVTGEARKAA